MKKGFERENASATLLACFNYCLIPIEDFFHFNTFLVELVRRKESGKDIKMIFNFKKRAI